MTKQEVKEMLEALSLDINLRAENLSINQYAQIANYIAK